MCVGVCGKEREQWGGENCWKRKDRKKRKEEPKPPPPPALKTQEMTWGSFHILICVLTVSSLLFPFCNLFPIVKWMLVECFFYLLNISSNKMFCFLCMKFITVRLYDLNYEWCARIVFVNDLQLIKANKTCKYICINSKILIPHKCNSGYIHSLYIHFIWLQLITCLIATQPKNSTYLIKLCYIESYYNSSVVTVIVA